MGGPPPAPPAALFLFSLLHPLSGEGYSGLRKAFRAESVYLEVGEECFVLFPARTAEARRGASQSVCPPTSRTVPHDFAFRCCYGSGGAELELIRIPRAPGKVTFHATQSHHLFSSYFHQNAGNTFVSQPSGGSRLQPGRAAGGLDRGFRRRIPVCRRAPGPRGDTPAL